MRILITGSNGFIGKNLVIKLNEKKLHKVVTYTRENSTKDLMELIKKVDAIIHLAGENRPEDELDFETVNVGLTKLLCDAVRSENRHIPIILASSIQASLDNSYGKSKYNSELAIKELSIETGNPVYIYRLPSVFGKWCKPNYNSVVATFCYNIAHNLSIQVHDPSVELVLVHVDDVVEEFISTIQKNNRNKVTFIKPEYKIKLGELASLIQAFRNSRNSLISESVGSGLTRALYSTYVSYFSPEHFSYSIPTYGDERGIFAEILKTKDSGQFSFFTAGPGVTRGDHYHHSKTEKFLVVQGEARFRFRHIISNEKYEILTSSTKLTVVETVPGWSHNITNIGGEEMVVLLWANEIFDQNKPDTIACIV